jgi:hypothetical protein
MDLLRRKKAVATATEGHRVLFVDSMGPAGQAGLVPYLDMITEILPEGLLVSGFRFINAHSTCAVARP